MSIRPPPHKYWLVAANTGQYQVPKTRCLYENSNFFDVPKHLRTYSGEGGATGGTLAGTARYGASPCGKRSTMKDAPTAQFGTKPAVPST